jgi:hypothetical protein
MLDELDALMDRMLALPVGDAEDLPPLPRDVPATAALTESTITEDAESEDGGEESGTESQESGGKDVGSRESSETQGSSLATKIAIPPRSRRMDLPRLDNGAATVGPHFTPQTLSDEPENESRELPSAAQQLTRKQESAAGKGQTRDSQDPGDATEPSRVEPIVRPATEVASNSASAFRPGRLPLLPLIAVNQIFDLCSLLLGPLGRGLRGERGRGFLGVVGLLCLGLAGAWLVFDQISGR